MMQEYAQMRSAMQTELESKQNLFKTRQTDIVSGALA